MKTFRLFTLIILLNCVKGISQPVITSFSPTSAIIGATITISGKNFSTTPANNIVRFGNVTGSVVSATATSLSVTVPTGASYGQLTVSVNNLTGYSSGFFTPSFTSCTNGSLTFGTPMDSVFYNANPFVSRDYDGDGKIDMANIFDSLYVKLNTSKSGLFSEATLLQYNGIGSNATYLTDGDLNGDGKLDILSAVGDTIFILQNESTPGNVSFIKSFITTDPRRPAGSAVIADFDGDGKPDIIITRINPTDTIFTLYKNISTNGNIAFASAKNFKTSIELLAISAADIDGDGKQDLVGVSFYGTVVFRNTSVGNKISFAIPDTASTIGFFMGIGSGQLEFGDFNGDGKIDIAISQSQPVLGNYTSGGGGLIYIISNTSTINSISFESAIQLNGGGGTNFAIADINGDGKPDIIFHVYYWWEDSLNIIHTTNYFTIYTNTSTTGNISFQSDNNYGNQNNISDGNAFIQVADMDGDGKQDVICGNQIFFRSCTLPVTLLDFSATTIDKQIAINWQTATEINTSHFIIQHSTDGSSFTDIGTVKAMGNGANSYSFTDAHPANGINYYRLQSVDKDGAVSFSKVVSVQFTVNSNQLTVYPNPSRDNVTISGNHIASVQVIDYIGRVVKVVSLKDATNPTLSVNSLPAGVYHLRIQTTDGNVSGNQLIIVK